jgi:hypothetical protein
MIADFEGFEPSELSLRPPFVGTSSGLWYDSRRDIAWIVLSDGVEEDPVSVWLGEDSRLHAAAQLDADGKLLCLAIGEASRHVPPYVVLSPDSQSSIRVIGSPSRNAVQVILWETEESIEHNALSMTCQQGSGFVHFVRDTSSMLVAVVIEPASQLAHPSLFPWASDS